jgi:hypothetical protein
MVYHKGVELRLSHKDCTSTPSLTLQIEELANANQQDLIPYLFAFQ